MAHYSLPYAQMPEQQYLMASHYHDNRMTALPEMGGWMEQTEGGGKFQLKRRRRCGQCGPCQVKDNCNKCQYCLRKDILKQACVLRKCVYLRKPQSHSRPEITNGGSKPSGGDGGERGKDGGGGGGRSSSCSSTNQDSPHKPSSSTPSAMPTPTPAPLKAVPVNPSAVAAAAAVVHSAELSSCQVAKTSPFPMPPNNKLLSEPPVRSSNAALPPVNSGVDPHRPSGVAVNEVMGAAAAAGGNPMRPGSFPPNKGMADPLQAGGMPVNKGAVEVMRSNGFPVNKVVCDPLRSSALDQHHSAMLNAAGALESCRMAYMSDTRGMDSVRGPAQVLGGPGSGGGGGGNTNGVAAFGMGNPIPASPACAMAKDFPPMPQREQFHAPADQWATVPYGYSHPNPWGPPQVSYGIHSGGSYYPGSLGTSAQLGMPGPANHFAAQSQPSFHRAVPFPHPDFPTHANYHASASAVPSTMTPPFYPPPMQIPSTLPNFPSFNQLPSSAGPHSSYSAARPPVYPGSFYSSFRPSYEPQIYHVQVSTPLCPLTEPHRPLSGCSSSLSSSSLCCDGVSGSGVEADVHQPGLGSDQHSDCNKLCKEIKVKEVESVKKAFPVFSVACSGKNLCYNGTSNSSVDSCAGKPTGEFTQQEHVTDPISVTKRDCGKERDAKQDTNSVVWDDLSQVLKRLRRQSDYVNCDGLNTLTSLRSDECCDLEKTDKNSDTTTSVTKVKDSSSGVDAGEYTLHQSRKRRLSSPQTETSCRKVCRATVTAQNLQKCDVGPDHSHSLGQEICRPDQWPSCGLSQSCIQQPDQGSVGWGWCTRDRWSGNRSLNTHQDPSEDVRHRHTSWDMSHVCTSKDSSPHAGGLIDVTHTDMLKDISCNDTFYDTFGKTYDTLGDISQNAKDTSGYMSSEDTLSDFVLQNTFQDISHEERLQAKNVGFKDHSTKRSVAGKDPAMALKNVAVFSPKEQKECGLPACCGENTDRSGDTDRINTDRVDTDRVDTDHVNTDRVNTDRVETDCVNTDRVDTNGVETEQGRHESHDITSPLSSQKALHSETDFESDTESTS